MGEVIWLTEIYEREDVTMGMAAKKERRANSMTPQTRRIIGRNVDLLWKRFDWKQPEPKGRTIVWYLLIPDMDEQSISTVQLAEIVHSYLEKPEKRQSIKDLVQALTK